MTNQSKFRFFAILSLLIGLLAFAQPASAAWTHLGGDPLFQGGIKGSGQTARNDFVKKSRTAKFNRAMQYAGLSKTERTATKQVIVRGHFKKCTLKYGERFEAMAFGTNGTSVDRNVVFRDRRYKRKGAPAFCITVKIVRNKGRLVNEFKLKVPWKCVNVGLVGKSAISVSPPQTVTPTQQQPQPVPTPQPQPQPTPTAPTSQPQPEKPKTPAPIAEMPVGAHTHVNGNIVVYLRFKTAPGHSATLTAYQASDGTLSDPQPSNWYDKQPCESGWTCMRLRYQAPSYPVDQVYLDSVITQDDGQWTLGSGQLKVEGDANDWDN